MILLITPHHGKYWIDFFDDIKAYDLSDYGDLFEEKPDGFWVVFIEENIQLDDTAKHSFIEDVIIFMQQYGIPFVKVSYPNLDRLILFTSCNPKKIQTAQNILVSFFHFDKRDMIWEAEFESDNSWEEGGWLSAINKAFSKTDNVITNEQKKQKDYKYALRQRSKAYKKILEEITMNRKSMVVSPVFGNIDYRIKQRSVFIIMPFNEDWSDDIYACINNICLKKNISVVRADNFMLPGVILDDIWKGINEAELIIADISEHNANVFYELGIAHTIGKDVILLHRKNSATVPFDITHRRYISYGLLPHEYDEFKNNLDLVLTSYFDS